MYHAPVSPPVSTTHSPARAAARGRPLLNSVLPTPVRWVTVSGEILATLLFQVVFVLFRVAR